MALRTAAARAWPLWLALGALLAQALLIANPGYFSHDELQWAAYASDGARVDWLDIGALQYRPLTFFLWTSLSRAAFDTPPVFHAVFALIGAANAVLLGGVLRRLGAPAAWAAVGGLAFVAHPFAMYTHGWVGTLGDLLWVACALLAAHAALALRTLPAALLAAALTAVALLAKEAALAMPALAAVAAFADAARRRQWIAVTAATGAVALAYLTLRHGALAGVGEGQSYSWHLRNIPVRAAEFALFGPLPTVFEVHNTRLTGIVGLAGAAVSVLATLAALSRPGWRWPVAMIAGGLAALGPSLVLDNPATQYGYGFAAWTAGVLVLALSRLRGWARWVVAAFLVACALHGAWLAWGIHRVGRIQAVFSPALARAAAGHPGTLHILPASDAAPDAWIFHRLSHEIPHYAGVPLRGRVRIVDAGAPAHFHVERDGSLTPLP